MAMNAVIGVDVGGTGTKAGIVDAEGAIHVRSERPTDKTAGTKGIIAIVEDLLSRSVGSSDIKAVGVGAAGFIDAASGSVTFSPNLVYDDPHIADALSTRVQLPVSVDNDANAAVWGERSFGQGRGLANVAMLTLGTGIGSGFVVDGKLLRGVTGAAAEFGHTVIDPKGPLCGCGLRGCLEQVASGNAIARMAREALDVGGESILAARTPREALSAKEVARAATEGDEVACDVLRRAGRALGIGLSNVANVFDPQAIILGGGVVRAGECFLGAARDELFRMTVAQRRRPMRLEITALGSDAGLLGAAALAWDLVAQ